jgi:DNA-binding NarL/FixJ family response regulator
MHEAEALAVGTVAEALAHPARFGCGFIIDHNLPDETGLDLLARLRDEEIHSPALLLTGLKSDALASRASHYSASYCVKGSDGQPAAVRALVRETRRRAPELAAAARASGESTSVVHLRAPAPPRPLASLGSPCDDCRRAATDRARLTHHEDFLGLADALRTPADLGPILFFEDPEPDPGEALVEALLEVHRRDRDIPLGYVAHHASPNARRRVLAVGARYVEHQSRSHERDVADMALALTVFGDELGPRLAVAADTFRLDPLERRLLPHLLRRAPRRHIAETFRIAENTLKQYVRELLRKAGVRTAPDLIERVRSLGPVK